MMYPLIAFLALICGCYSEQAQDIPVTLSRGKYAAVSPGQVDYYVVTPCPDSCAQHTWAVLSIALPSNPTWDLNEPLVIMELSTNQWSFDQTSVFETNYYWPTTYFGQIVWQYPGLVDTSGRFYIRVTAPIASVSYSFEIQFLSSGSPTAGAYNFQAFKASAVPPNSIFNNLIQSISSDQTAVVTNFQTDLYFIKFCVADFPSNCNANDYTVIASVVSTPNRPMSQFNLYACPWAYGASCSIYVYSVADLTATGVAQVIITNGGQMNTTDGIYFLIYGIGGERDKQNEYTLDVKLYC